MLKLTAFGLDLSKADSITVERRGDTQFLTVRKDGQELRYYGAAQDVRIWQVSENAYSVQFDNFKRLGSGENTNDSKL